MDEAFHVSREMEVGSAHTLDRKVVGAPWQGLGYPVPEAEDSGKEQLSGRAGRSQAWSGRVAGADSG